MNQRLIWNFEYSLDNELFSQDQVTEHEREDVKWEVRYFWPQDEIIVLNFFDKSLSELANYQQKHREDVYYLLPGTLHNIKKRRQEIFYKPLIRKENSAVAYAEKINMSQDKNDEFLHELSQQIKQHGVEVRVTKEAFIYTFPTHPKIKLELARIEIQEQIYFSACIEGKSQNLVESIAGYLLKQQISCDYVSFLNKILQL